MVLIIVMRNILRGGIHVRGLTALLLFVLAIAAGCSGPATSGGGIKVVTTTTILADLVKNVGGDRVSVASIAPAGAEIEEYSPKPDDARKVSEAALLVVNGLDLDKWSGDLLKNKKASAVVIELTDGLPAIDDNPHMWFNVELARKYVEKIRDSLIQADTAGRDAYTRAASAYDAELVKLHDELKKKAAEVPAARRKLVTSHDAFPYFARAYGFEIVGFVQPEADKEPSAAELAELVEKVKKAGVKAVFVESQASPKLSEALAKEAGVTRVVGDIPTDSLGEKPADTYVGLMRTVMDRIVNALK
jgi:zinc/manganese transport system substrate-binding protein/manganese/iron transport system substrate-binding protein